MSGNSDHSTLYAFIPLLPEVQVICSFIARGKSRDASNDMSNRRYLAWRLISPAAVAKLFNFRTSNLPPSKEGGQGDCDGANQVEVYEQKAVSLRRQPFRNFFWSRLVRVQEIASCLSR